MLCPDQDLETQISQFLSPVIQPLQIRDWYILSSAFQKALRRANYSCAIASAQALLIANSKAFWRRLVTIAFEDFGLSDLNLTKHIVTAAKDSAWRKKMGGDFHVASFLIAQLVRAPTDRRIDDLYMLGIAAGHDRAYARLVETLTPSTRALVHYASGLSRTCERAIPRRSFRGLIAKACEDSLDQGADILPDITELCRQGRKLSQCLLPLLLPETLKTTLVHNLETELICDQFSDSQINGILSCAIDGFTGPGRQLLGRVIREDRSLWNLLSRNVGNSPRKAAAALLFCVEGGLLRRSLRDSSSSELYSAALGCWSYLPPPSIPEALSLMRNLLPKLEERRRDLFAQMSQQHQPSHNKE